MPKTHLAILIQPWLDLILDGHKTIETRISKVKVPPYESIDVGDHVIMKERGGPIKGAFEVDEIETYYSDSQLDSMVFDEICNKVSLDIFGLEGIEIAYRQSILNKWCNSKYATFLHVKNVQHIETDLLLKKKNRKAWIILGEGTTEEWIQQLSIVNG
ncbi:ASCH domain-containing protein [Candidatus Poribacteria bacterium]|nr:ASCH domain-containing protein [Candidatus Poribacteria bacterium]